MKDYDDEIRDLEGVTRTFKLRGIEFEAKPTMPAKHLSDLADIQTGQRVGGLYDGLTTVIRATLVESNRPRWDDLMERELDIPITMEELMKVADDLVAKATGRPPTQPSPSGSTGETTTTKSTDGSDSMVALGSKPST